MATKRYRVANPRKVPKGVPTLRAGTKTWTAGAPISESDLTETEWKHYLRHGFIEEVQRG